jgi:hypothetical protein
MSQRDYVEFELSTGRVLRHGTFAVPQAKRGNGIAFITAVPGTQRIECESLDPQNQAVNPQAVEMSPEEIEAAKPRPKPVAEDDQRAAVTRKQWRELQARLAALEEKSIK